MTLAPIRAPTLDHPGLVHGFFTRAGGVSEGVYTSLNGGIGSRDAPDAVAENRRRMAAALGVAPGHLVVPVQTHSALAAVIETPLADEARLRVDGIATRVPGLALGVTGADCGVTLLADPVAGVVGAVHSGWRGALGGVLATTVDAMVSIGARREAITAVLGPTIAQASYEVGPAFVAQFMAADAATARFFAPAAREGHAQFDLPGFIGQRLAEAGIGRFTNLGLDTYADETRFFSYRRMTHRGEPDYGRLVAAIAIAP